MKKKIIVLCVILLMLMGTSASAYAIGTLPEMGLMAEYHISSKASLTISSGGLAEVTGKILGVPGITTRTSVILYLEKYKNGAWVEDDSWFSEGGTVNTTLSETKYVEKGYKYRAKAVCYAFSTNDHERVVRYSDEVYY